MFQKRGGGVCGFVLYFTTLGKWLDNQISLILNTGVPRLARWFQGLCWYDSRVSFETLDKSFYYNHLVITRFLVQQSLDQRSRKLEIPRKKVREFCKILTWKTWKSRGILICPSPENLARILIKERYNANANAKSR